MKRSIPRTMLLLALVLALGFATVHALGWREATTVLSGTFVSDTPWLDGLRCVLYLAGYFAGVVVCPILVTAAPILAWLERRFLRPPAP